MLRIFPVASQGQPHFTHDFGVTGKTGKPHAGIDIFAEEGTPILAVDDGQVRYDEDPLGGHAFYLRADDRTTYYGAHLSAYEGTGPRRVVAGEVIGYVGRTGNASDTSPHLHFEAHPEGGPAVDPYVELAALTPVAVPVVAARVEPPPLPLGFPPLPPPPELSEEPAPAGRGVVVVFGAIAAAAGLGALILRGRGAPRLASAR